MTALSHPTSPARAAQDRERLRGLVVVLAAVLAYVLLHSGFRMIASGVLGEDDTLEQILVQELRFGYEARQPPLYDWVLYAVQQVTGPRLVSFLAIKYAALTGTAVLLYLAAFRILGDRLWAALTVESLALIYQISWRYHEGFTHEVLAMVSVAATLWAFLRLYDHGRWRDYLLFGVIAGLGFNTEPNYAVYQMCLWGAVAMQPAIRARTVRRRLLLSAAVALALASPYLSWLLSDPAHWDEIFAPSRRGFALDRVIGVKDAVRGPLMYLLPLVAILPAVFPGYLRTAWDDVRALFAPGNGAVAYEPARPDFERLVLATMVLGVAFSIAGGLLFGIGGYAMHVLMPLYITSVIWLIAVARRSPRGGERQMVFARVALAIAVLALVVRLANMFVYDPVCSKCRWGIPYAGLAQALRQHGATDDAVFVAVDDELAGNLRPHFPRASFVLLGSRHFVPHGVDPARRDVIVVWDETAKATRPLADTVAAALGRAPQLDAGLTLQVPWRHLWRDTGYRSSEWRMLKVHAR